jgi:hypothetical protein
MESYISIDPELLLLLFLYLSLSAIVLRWLIKIIAKPKEQPKKTREMFSPSEQRAMGFGNFVNDQFKK